VVEAGFFLNHLNIKMQRQTENTEKAIWHLFSSWLSATLLKLLTAAARAG
jgi:hypothetical protein